MSVSFPTLALLLAWMNIDRPIRKSGRTASAGDPGSKVDPDAMAQTSFSPFSKASISVGHRNRNPALGKAILESL
ncbi:MAG: hypothetical protein ACR2QJ_02410 [Geminicoccaceae bacterium]